MVSFQGLSVRLKNCTCIKTPACTEMKQSGVYAEDKRMLNTQNSCNKGIGPGAVDQYKKSFIDFCQTV